MLALADPILRGSLERRESRGSHYRVDYLERNDEKFLRTTIATYNPETDESEISFEETEYGVVKPRIRDYSTTKKQKKDDSSKKDAARTAFDPAVERTSTAVAGKTPEAAGGKVSE
jgi:hypothetical protein